MKVADVASLAHVENGEGKTGESFMDRTFPTFPSRDSVRGYAHELRKRCLGKAVLSACRSEFFWGHLYTAGIVIYTAGIVRSTGWARFGWSRYGLGAARSAGVRRG
jgi:hypothetical protein